jgi:hypothetical protein
MPLRTLCPNCHGQRTTTALHVMAPAKQPSQVFRLATALSAAELVNAAAIFAAVWGKSNLMLNGNPKRPTGQTTSAASRVDRFNGYRAGT